LRCCKVAQALDLLIIFPRGKENPMLDTSALLEAVGADRQDRPDDNVIDRLRFDEGLNVPIELTDADLWANYINDDLYEMDKKVREFLKKTTSKRRKGGYRTTASLVFAWIYGRQPEAHDGSVCKMLHEILKYYCSSYTGATTYLGKRVNRVYNFSKYSFINRRPYSLRLRLEESDDGRNPWRKSPVDDSKKRANGRRKHS
jgi:hypothetical protein